jgi:S-adenosylmethionine-diacylgycerolhomoserine-N-methlytransferase
VSAIAADHGALMDATYKWQRHIYDLTRKYFLFGRDRLIAELAVPPGGAVLEVGCGTGRNLALVARRYPDAALYGLDISAEMLKSAAAQAPGARLAEADATGFDAETLFGRAGFDRVMISFALSMIPDWQAAIGAAAQAVAPGGSLHIVDFGSARGLPVLARKALDAWLAHFHVQPRRSLPARTQPLLGPDFAVRAIRGPLGYYTLIEAKRR